MPTRSQQNAAAASAAAAMNATANNNNTTMKTNSSNNNNKSEEILIHPNNTNRSFSTTNIAIKVDEGVGGGGRVESPVATAAHVTKTELEDELSDAAAITAPPMESSFNQIQTSTTPNVTTTTTRYARNAGFNATANSMEQRRQSHLANTKLIRLVRRHPWLYDSHHNDYAKKHIIEKTWGSIALTCNEPVGTCKERWRNIRAAFARSINIYKTQSGPNRVKPYYLHKELKFLIRPMTKGRKPQSATENTSTEDDSSHDGQEDVEADGDDDCNNGFDDDADCIDNETSGNIGNENNKEIIVEDTSNDSHANESSNKSKCLDTSNSNGSLSETAQLPTAKTKHHNSNQLTATQYHLREKSEDYPDLSNNFDDFQELQFLNSNNNNINKRQRFIEFDPPQSVAPASNKRRRLERFDDLPEDADSYFIKSLYYDMRDLNSPQKLRLKKGIYQVLEQVAITNNTNTVQLPTTSRAVATSRTSLAAQESILRNLHHLNEAQLHHLNLYMQTVMLRTNSEANPTVNNISRINANNNSNSNNGNRRVMMSTSTPVNSTQVPQIATTTIPKSSTGACHLVYPLNIKDEPLDPDELTGITL